MSTSWCPDGRAVVITFAALLVTISPLDVSARDEDEAAVKQVVDRFLIAVGAGNLDALPDMFVPDANIGTASMREGSWVTTAVAFVRAKATVVRDGQPRLKNIDYFTLVRRDGAWKILSASYVAKPIESR